MRKKLCAPMIALCLLLTACGNTGGEEATIGLMERYSAMTGCSMEAVVTCEQEGLAWEALLRCDYVPEGETVVEVLEPELIAGVKAVMNAGEWQLEYEGERLNAGAVGTGVPSPALCLPQLMSALRDGWLLEENEEKWGEIPCVRLSLDQSGPEESRLISTIWLRQADGAPLRGEIALDEKIILTAEFTDFSFYDIINAQNS